MTTFDEAISHHRDTEDPSAGDRANVPMHRPGDAEASLAGRRVLYGRLVIIR